MKLDIKSQQVKEVKEKLKSSQAFFISHNLGVAAGDMSALRKELKKNDAELKIVKNTLVRRALEDLDYKDQILDDVKGPTVIAFSYGDPVNVAKAILKLENLKLAVKAGMLGKNKLNAKAIEQLSKLPSREELVARVVRTIAAPLSNFMGVMTAVPRNFLTVLTAIKDKK